MITSIVVYKDSYPMGTMAIIPVKSSKTSPLWIKDIKGLGPVAATIATSRYPSGRNGIVERTTLLERNIVIRLALRRGYSSSSSDFQAIRKEAYKYFSPGREIGLVVNSTDTTSGGRLIEGVVESVEPTIFTEKPELVVSIMCPNPYFVESHVTTIKNGTNDSSGRSVIEASGFGEGSTGFVFAVTASGPMTELSLTKSSITDYITVEGFTMVAGEVLNISTVEGEKDAWIYNNTNTSLNRNVTHLVNSGSLSMTMSNWDWDLSVQTDSPNSTWTLSYSNYFLGF